MLARTHSEPAPWTVVRANDKRRARLAIISHVLAGIDYKGRNDALVNDRDDRIIMPAPQFQRRIAADE